MVEEVLVYKKFVELKEMCQYIGGGEAEISSGQWSIHSFSSFIQQTFTELLSLSQALCYWTGDTNMNETYTGASSSPVRRADGFANKYVQWEVKARDTKVGTAVSILNRERSRKMLCKRWLGGLMWELGRSTIKMKILYGLATAVQQNTPKLWLKPQCFIISHDAVVWLGSAG